MGEVFFIRGRHHEEPDPLPLKEAFAAGVESLRLAWSADPKGLMVVVVAQTVTAAAQVAELFSSGPAVDAVLSAKRGRLPAGRLAAVGAVSLLSLAGRHSSFALHFPLGEKVNRRADARILDAVASMELADVESPEFQDRLGRAFNGAQSQRELLNSALAIPNVSVGVIAALAAVGARDIPLVPFALAGAVPQWVILRRTQDPARARSIHGREMREAFGLRRYLTGTAAGHELRVFGATPFLRARYDELAERAARSQEAIMRQNARRNLLGSLSGAACAGPAAARLALRVSRQRTSVADALSSGLALRKLSSGCQRVVSVTAGLRRAAAVTRDYREFKASLPDHPGGPAPPEDFERITVEDLSFSYPGSDRPVLDGVNLEIRRGEVVALVGENGSGKTTLAKLLCCLYRPASGTIRWDDVDAGECDPAGVRSRVAVVFQDFVQYSSLTAAENIGIGMPSRLDDREAIVEAAKRAGAHDAIAALPNGYDTVMSRPFGGSELSTGQWQRVALARAFLRDAPLVVLDEPTAALDPRAERDLFETVGSLYRSRSALLISHRLSSVRFADRICVLAGGRITETGPHEELLALGGTYAELFELQARSYR